MRFDIRCTIILLSCMLVIGLAGCKEDEYDLSENIEDVLKEETYEKGDERTTVDCGM